MARKQGTTPINFHQGTRAEYLAQFALSRVGLVVPVPRPSDHFLVDMFLHLAVPNAQRELHITGPTLALQVKSSRKPVKLNSVQVQLFTRELDFPVFFVVVDSSRDSLEIYGTAERLCHAYFEWNSLTVYFEKPPAAFKNSEASGRARLYLGQPVYRTSIAALDSVARGISTSARMHRVLQEWSRLDLYNLGWRTHGLPVVWRRRMTVNRVNVTPNRSNTEPVVLWGPTSAGRALRAIASAAVPLAKHFKTEGWSDVHQACEQIRIAAANHLRPD